MKPVSSPIIPELKKILPEASWPWVIPALQEDPLVWEALSAYRDIFRVDELQKIIHMPEDCSPASLALTLLNYPAQPASLRSLPLLPIDNRFSPLLEDIDSKLVETLNVAGLQALSLRQLRYQSGSWDDWSHELWSACKTTLSCLYGIVPDQLDLLRAIVPTEASGDQFSSQQIKAYQALIHIILSNPLKIEAQTEILNILLEELSDLQQFQLVEYLYKARPNLASRLVSHIAGLPAKFEFQEPKSIRDFLSLLEKLYTIEKSHHISDQSSQEMSALIKSLKISRQLQARFAARIALAGMGMKDQKTSLAGWEQAFQLDPDSPLILPAYLFFLLDQGRSEEIKSILRQQRGKGAPQHPLVIGLEQIVENSDPSNNLNQNGSKEKLRMTIRVAIDYLRDLINSQDETDIYDVYLQAVLTFLFLQQLAQNGLLPEVIQALDILNQILPRNGMALVLLASALQLAGQYAEAAEIMHLAVALDPPNLSLRRYLAICLEANQSWENAHLEWNNILDRQEKPAISDQYASIACKIHSGYFDQAVQSCRNLLNEDGNNGVVYAFLGKSIAALGDLEEGKSYLDLAVQLAPQHPFTWLALAGFHKNSGRLVELEETLMAASQTIPNCPEIHLALGDFFLTQGAPTQALAEFKRAVESINKICKIIIPFTLPEFINHPSDQAVEFPENFLPRQNQDWLSPHVTSSQLKTQILSRYGKTLLTLGHGNEARQVLEETYFEYPNNPEVATIYAEALIKQQKYEQAIEPLKTVVASNATTAEPYIAYAQCLMALNKVPNRLSENNLVKEVTLIPNNDPQSNPTYQIISLLEKALEIEPDNAEAKVYLAEARAQEGEYENALGLFNEVMDSQILLDKNWSDRLALDMGQVTLKLGRGDLALAALKDANQNNPQIQRMLAEAYHSMNLVEDAFKTARNALQLAPDDLDNLIWFVNFSQRLKDHRGEVLPRALSEANSALEHAIDLAPQRSDLWIAKGQLCMITGDQIEALKSFRKLIPGDPINPILNAPPADLYLAGKYLLELNDPPSAIACLEYSLQHNPSQVQDSTRIISQPEPALLDLLSELAKAYKGNEQTEKALQAIEQALAISPTEIGLHLTKANLLLELGHRNHESSPDVSSLSNAIDALEDALKVNPNNPNILLYLTLLKRALGNLPAALENAKHLIQVLGTNSNSSDWEQRIQLDAQDNISNNAAQALAYDVSIAMLQFDKAKQYLPSALRSETNDWITPYEITGDALDYPNELDYLCLQLEESLNSNQTQNTGNHLSHILKTVQDDPRLLSLQARLQYRQGDIQTANNYLDTALEIVRERYPANDSLKAPGSLKELNSMFASANLFHYLANACHELFRWDETHKILGDMCVYTPNEPQPYLEVVRSKVLRAEYTKLCQDTGARFHAPTPLNSQEEQIKIQKALDTAKKLISSWPEADRKTVEASIQKWNARSKAILDPNPQSSQLLADLPASADDIAAQISCLRTLQRVPEACRVAEFYPQEPTVLTQLALTLAGEQPKQALLAVQTAAEILNRQESLTLQKATSSLLQIDEQIKPIVFALLASLTFQNGNRIDDTQNAIAAIEKALQSWPDEPTWHALASQIYQLQDIPQAIAHLEQALAQDPSNADYAVRLGKLFSSQNQILKAIETLKTVSQTAPNKPEIWKNLAEAYFNLGRFNEAKDCLEKSLHLNPQDVQLLILRGQIALQENDPQTAEKCARNALNHNPDDPASYLLLVRALSARGKFVEAQALLEKNFPNNSQTLPLYLERANIISKQLGPQAAIESLNQIVDRFPDQPALLATLAEFHEQIGDHERALHIAQQALRVGHNLSEDNHFSDHARLHFLLGKLMRNAGQLDQSIQHLNEAILLTPGFIEPYLELGQTHLDRRQYKEAIQIYQQAIAAEPDSALPYYHAGLAYRQCKDYISAEQMLRQAAKLSPDDLMIQRQLAAVIALNLVHNRRQ